MGSVAEDVAAAKANFSSNLASAKQTAKISVAEAKSALLEEFATSFSPSNPIPNLREQFSDVVTDARKQFLLANPDPKRVVRTENNIQFLADGTLNFITADGTVIRDVRRDKLQDLMAIESQRAIDIDKVKRNPDALQGPINDLLSTGAKVLGDIATGTLQKASDITGIGTSAQTLTEQVDKYNSDIVPSLFDEFNVKPISKEDLAKYQNVVKQIEKGAQLSPAEKEYVDSEDFKIIEDLEIKVHGSEKTYKAIDEEVKLTQDALPTTHADDVAFQLGAKRTLEEEGIPAGLWKILIRDWSQLVKQGFESIPYMIAFTAGGPVTQTAVLYAIAVAKAREVTTTFMKEHDRDPTTEERMRIEFWAGAATVAEKFGDMAAVKAIPFAKLGRANSILNQINSKTLDTVKTAINKTKFVSRPALALGGEGISGGLTAYAEQIAEKGKVTDPGQIGLDALAEAVGTVGGIGGIVAGKAAVQLPEAITQAVAGPSREERRIEEELAYLNEAIASEKPIKVKETGQGQPIQDEIDVLNEGLENIKDPEQREIKLEQIRQNLSKAGKDDSEAEATLEEYIAEDTKRRDELTAALEKVLPKEVFEKRKAAILAEQKERQESKAKKKLLKTKEGKEARIAEINKEIEAVRAKEGFVDPEAIRKLEEEKQELTEGLDPFATRIKRTFVGDEGPQEPVDDRTYTPLEEAEFNKLVKSIDVKKLTDPATDPAELDEALNKIAEIHKHKELTDSQDQILSKIKDELAQVDPRFKEGPLTSIKGVVNATSAQLKKQLRIARKNKKIEDEKLINAELQRRDKQAELKKIENQKTMGEVHSQVVDGPGTRWKGIHTYYDEIVKTVAEIKDKVIAEEAVRKTIQRMSTHVGNLKRKKEAFTAAYNKPTLKRGIRVVRGTVGEGRVMKYTEEVMSVKAFKAARKKNEYVTAIIKEKRKGFDYTSEGLIKKVGLEVEYGNQFLTVVKGFRETSFSRAAAELDARRKALKEKQAKAAKVRFKLKSALILNKKTQDSLDALFKTKSNKELQKYIVEKREKIKQLKNISEKAQEEAVLAYAVLAFNARTPEKKKKKESKPKPDTTLSNEKVWPIKRLKATIAKLQAQIDKANKENRKPNSSWQKNIDSMTAELKRRGADVEGKSKSESIQDYAKRMITKFIPKTARKHLKKELVKAAVATQFIGEGKQDSSTDVYREIYDRIGLANTGKYTSKDTIFIASNGQRYGRVVPVGGKDGKLRGVYKNVDLAIEAGATIIMDTAGHLAKTNYNVGEEELAEYLEKKGYERQGETGVWKQQPAKGEQGTKTPSTKVEHFKGSLKHLIFNTIANLIKGGSQSSAKKSKWVSTWYGPIAYEYSGGNETISHPAQEMPKEFADIARDLEKELGHPEGYFNSALMNVFPKGIGIGKHADDEVIYGADDQEQTIGAVATVSLGGVSVVKITSNDGKKQWNLKVEDGDVYIMPGGNFQRKHKHEVGKSSAPRISMTFRHVPKNRIPEQQDPLEQRNAEILNAAKNVTISNVLQILKSLTRQVKDSAEWIHVSDEFKKAYENVLIKLTALAEKKSEKESTAVLMQAITEMQEQKAPEGNETWNYEVLPQRDIVRVVWNVVRKELAKRKAIQDKKTNFKGLKAEDIIPDGFIESFSEDYSPTKEALTEDKTKYGKLTPEIVKGFKTAQDAVEWLINNTDGILFKRFAQRIKDSIPPIPITFINKDAITLPDGSRAAGVAHRSYEMTEEGIFATNSSIELARSGVNESTLLHELFHIAVAVLFTAPITLKQKAAKKQLLDIATHLKTISDAKEVNGVQLNPNQLYLLDLMRGLDVPGDEKTQREPGIEELITYALTKPQAKALMMSLPALETGYKSLWSEFVITIRKLMGMEDTEQYPPTLFDQIVESTDILIEKPEGKKTKQKPISRQLPKESQSKQGFYVLYPEIITKDGTLAEDSVLAKHFKILESLATALGLESPERKDIEAALKALPDNKDFLEAKIETKQLETTITEEQLKKAKTKQHASIGGKSVVERVAENLENVFGILGVYANKLINIRKIRDKKALNGIHTLPDAVFEDTHAFSGLPITDASGKKQYKTLERALIALGVSEEGAAELVEEYSRYARKYEAIRVDGRVLDTEGNPQGNTAINKPLSILYSEDQNVTEFPPQIIFGMMLGTVTWLQQNPTNIRFKSDLGREIFLYGDHAQLSPSERGQVKNIGHSYTEAVSTIGNNIISILKISGKDIDTDVYYNNLSVALGQLALQVEHGPQELTVTDKTSYTQPTVEFEGDESRLHIEGKSWNFKPAKKEGRLFNNADKKPYKHIKLNLKKTSNGKEIPLKLPKATVDASKEILTVIDADVDTEGGKPAQKPFPKVVDNIKNSLGGVANEVKAVLSLLQGNDEKQHVSWTGTQSLDIAVKLDEADEREALYKLAGVDHVDDTYHTVRRESIEASNADKTNAIDGLLDAHNHEDGNLLKKFYFRYKLQIQNRIMMQSSGTINPQASGVDRYYVRPTKASVKYNEKELWKFKLSVVGNLGFKIDKNDLTSALDAFDYLIADADVLEAVSAIQNINEKGQPAKLAKLLLIIKNKEVLGEADHGSSILNGLTGLAQGLTVGSNVTEAGESVKATKLGILKTDFESDVVLEIDGISSGFAQNALQFPMYGKEGNELRRNQTGTYIGPTEISTTHDPYQQDIYQDVGAKVEEHSGVDTAEDFHNEQTGKSNFDRDKYIRVNNSLNELYPTLKNGDMRSLIKYPFLIFMYGGGPKSISEGIAGDILSEFYVKLDLHQRYYHKLKTQKAKNTYLKEEVLPFLEHLKVVGAINNVMLFKATFVNPKKVKDLLLSDEVAITRISTLLRPRLQLGLESILLGTKDARDAAIQAGEVLHAVFMAHFEKAQEEARIIRDENGKDTGQKRPNLTEKEINELIRKELISLLPQYKGPLQQTDQSFIDLTKRQSSESDSTSEMVTIEYKDPKNKRGIGTASTTPKRMTFTSPGVSSLIRMIINMDAAILTKTLAAHPHVLMLHDAVMGDPSTLEAANTTYGKWYVKLNREYSVLDSITKRMNAVIAKTEAKDTENGNTKLMDSVDRWILTKAFINRYAKAKTSRKFIVQDINDVNKTVQRERKKVEDEISERGGRIISSQLYMARKPIFEATQIILDKEKNLRLKISNLVDLIFKDVPKDVRNTPSEFEKEEQAISEAFRKEIKKAKKGKGLVYSSLPDQKRDNPITKLVGDITKENILATFEDMQEHSENYYENDQDQTKHAETLKRVLTKLADGLKDSSAIRFTQEEIDGITQGEFDPVSKRIRVSLSRQGPLSTNAQSPQEVYVHELVHAIVTVALAKNPLLRRRIEKLYRQTKQDLAANDGYKIFLNDPKSKDKAAKETAKEQYDFLFNNPENEKHKLGEFLAYAVTNRQLVNYLSGTKTKIHYKYRKEETLFTRAIDVFEYFVELAVDTVLRAFNKRGGFGAKANHEMLAVLEALINIQGNNRNRLERLQDKLYKNLDGSDQFLRKFGDEQSLAIIESEPAGFLKRVGRVAVGTGYLAISKNAQTLKTRQIVYNAMGDTLRHLALEVGEGILGKQLIQQLLFSKVNVSKARQEAERFTIKWFNGIWKSVDASKPKGMSVDLRENLTNVIFRTDLSSLLNMGLSHAEIASFIGDRNKIDARLRYLEKQILNKRPAKRKYIDHAVDYAKELGEYMAYGDVGLEVAHMNAFTIARKYLAKPEAGDLALIEAYATLTALKVTRYDETAAVKELVDAEFAVDATQNGFIDLLDSHIEFVDRSRKGNFGGNPTQMVKGYIVERIDNLTDMKVGLETQRKDMENEGYPEMYGLGDIPGLKPGQRINDKIFIGRNAPPIPYVSAIMSTTNKRNIGTTLTEILSESPNYQKSPGVPDMAKIKQAIRNIHKEQEKLASRRKLKFNNELRLRPVLDEKENVTDYRVIMNHVTRKQLLNPDLEIQNVFAHMQSSYIDRVATIKNDKRTIELLVYEQKERLPSHRDEFIDFLDPANGFIDRYYRLPKEVRMYMDRFTVDGKFMVRKDAVNKIFGYQARDLRNIPGLNHPSMVHIKRFAGLFHYILRQIIGYGKDRIVIAMPQVWLYNAYSNVMQLMMRNIPLSYIIHKTIEGFHEYQAYRTDTEERRELKNTINIKNLDKENSPEAIRVAALTVRIESNKIHAMSAAGLNSLIVEDLNDASLDGYINRGRRFLKTNKWYNASDRLSTTGHSIAANIFMTRSTGPYQIMRQIVQMTDFLGRYVMMQHAMEIRGLDFNTAMHEALDAFVLFDEALAPALESLESLGATVFLSYFLRNQRASRQVAMRHPTGVAISGAFQYSTGIPTLGNLDSAFIAGDIMPTTMYLDELFDEANNPTGLDLLNQALGDIFS